MDISGGRKVFIETPLGLIVLSVGGGKRERKLVVELPESLTAHHNVERCDESPQFGRRTEDGRFVPKSVAPLLMVTDDSGAVVGLTQAQTIRIKAHVRSTDQ